jgi:hypothetical protein
MKNLFRGYYPPTDEELDQMWDNGLIVLDTNALLNFFRYTATTRNEFFTVLKAVEDKLWIPYQIGLEFQRRQLDVIADQTKAYSDVEKAVEGGIKGVLTALQSFRIHPLLDKAALAALLSERMQDVSDAVGMSRDEYKARVVAGGENERIFELISDLYTSRIGEPSDQGVLDAIYIEGAARYEAKVPPGYMDKDKREPDRYGDLVLWKQLLAHATQAKLPALFITDDGKEDWWRRDKGKTHGPRVELVDEYFEASGQRIHFYAPERFLEFAKTKLKIAVSEHSLIEVEALSRERPVDDLNALFAERSHIQSLRNEAKKALIFEGSKFSGSHLELIAAQDHLAMLRSRQAVLEEQIHGTRHALDGLEEGEVWSSIVSHLTRLEMQREDLEKELTQTYERVTRNTRNQRVHSDDLALREYYETELQSLDDRLREIDHQLDNRR